MNPFTLRPNSNWMNDANSRGRTGTPVTNKQGHGSMWGEFGLQVNSTVGMMSSDQPRYRHEEIQEVFDIPLQRHGIIVLHGLCIRYQPETCLP